MANHYFECIKLFKGMVAIFDYRLNQCYKDGDDLVLKHKGREMLIPHNKIKEKALKLSRQKFKSKFNSDKLYEIYHFKWNPTDSIEIKNKQLKLFS